MGNRTARHQRPGQKNLRGRKSASFCPCCDDVINHREKILADIARREMQAVRTAAEEQAPEGPSGSQAIL